MPPRAVLALGQGATDTEVAVVSADGRVEFLAAATGTLLRTIETGTAVWTLRFPSPGPSVDPNWLVFAGAPLQVARGRTVAVVDDALLDWEVSGARRELLRAPWLRDARLLTHGGPGGAVFIALADGRIARVGDATTVFAAVPAAGTPTVLRLTGPDGILVVGGTAPSLRVLGARDLAALPAPALREGRPPVTAIGYSPESGRLVVAMPSYTMECFEVVAGGLGRVGHDITCDPPPMAVVLREDGRTEYLALYSGSLWRFDARGNGRWVTGGAHSRALGRFCGGGVVIQGRDDGSVSAESSPGGKRLWKRGP